MWCPWITVLRPEKSPALAQSTNNVPQAFFVPSGRCVR